MTFRNEFLRIGGQRVNRSPADREDLLVVNPYTCEPVGSVPRAHVDQVRQALDLALAYRPSLSRYQRAEILQRAAHLVAQRRDSLSDLITAESGLCKQDSLYEIGRVHDVLLAGAHAALADDSRTYPCDVSAQGRQRRIYTLREPLAGVIAAITPFNHPMNQVAHKVVPSIASNNRMVLKPSEKVPLSAYALHDVLAEAGLPAPMLQIITGDPAEIADELLTHPAVHLVSFTGGVAIGKHIANRVGYRRTVLELGGNDPLIVCADADLEQAAQLALYGSYRNSGQRCTAVKRILVDQSLADPFVERLAELTLAWRYGDPANPKMDMGTVIDEDAARRIEARIDAALAGGAVCRAGHSRAGALLAPTVLDHVDPAMELVREETFGPVAPVIRFHDLDEAIQIANGTAFGLSSGVCTQRLDTATRLIQALHVGTVNINEVPGYRLESTPFGGIKDSGLGYKEGVDEAIKSFTNLKTYSLPWPAV